MRRGRGKQRVKRHARFRLYDGRYPTTSASLAESLSSLDDQFVPAPLRLALVIPLGLAKVIGFSWVLSRRVVLRLGEDGLMVEAKRRAEFVSWNEVEDVSVVERELPETSPHQLSQLLRLKRGSGDIELAGPMDTLRRAEAAIRAAQARYAGGWADVDAGVLDRGERDPASWVGELLALAAGARDGYRTAPPSRGVLWSIVRSPSIPASRRGAAAIALGDLDRRESKRLRVLAKRTARPELKTVFECCVARGEADRERLGELLGDLERAR